MKHHHLEVLFAGVLLSLSLPAEAHTGHGVAHDFRAGLAHPLLGIDHILVMVGVGLWAGGLGGAARAWLPAAFLASMAAGASLSYAGIALLKPEIEVAASVLAIGVILLGIPAKIGFSAKSVGRVLRASLLSSRFARSVRAPNPPCARPVAGGDARKGGILARNCSDARRHPPYGLGCASGLAALFACSHGYVHALEAGSDSQALGYAGGFLVSTALLLGIGLMIGHVSRKRGHWIKSAFGAICAGAGITLLLGA